MAVIVLVSAAGSPGVTTSALALALGWPRPVVVVEADPTGGSAVLAGYFRGATAPAGGLLDLVWAERESRLAEALRDNLRKRKAQSRDAKAETPVKD